MCVLIVDYAFISHCLSLQLFGMFHVIVRKEFLVKPLSVLPGYYSVLQFFICSQIMALPLKCDLSPPFPVFQMIHAAISACVITPHFSLQKFHAGSINFMKALLHFIKKNSPPITSTADDAAMKQLICTALT